MPTPTLGALLLHAALGHPVTDLAADVTSPPRAPVYGPSELPDGDAMIRRPWTPLRIVAPSTQKTLTSAFRHLNTRPRALVGPMVKRTAIGVVFLGRF